MTKASIVTLLIAFAIVTSCSPAPPAASPAAPEPSSASPVTSDPPAPSATAAPSAPAPEPAASASVAPAAPPPPPAIEPEPIDPAKLDPKGPASTYLRWSAALAKAKTLGALDAYYPKQVREANAKSPAKEKAATLTYMKNEFPTKLEVLAETISGETAKVSAKGTLRGASVKGTIALVREGDKWVIESQEWDDAPAKAEVGTPTVTPPAPPK